MKLIEILRRPQVEQMVGLRRSALYRMMQDGQFPRPVSLSKRAVGWRKADVQDWLASRSETTAR